MTKPAKRIMYMIDGKPHWICGKCKEKKPETEFWTNHINSSGLYSNCKKCHRDYTRGKKYNSLTLGNWILSLERMFEETEKTWKSHEKMRIMRIIKNCRGVKK